MSSRRYPALEEYGLIGDGRSAALVGRDGSVDWWCPDRFDAPSVFARLLDDRIGGFCSLAPAGAVHASPMWESAQRYRPGTNVLVTEFRGTDAGLRVTDFMPWPGRDGGSGADGPRTVIRRVEALGGPVQAELRFAPRFDYARREPAYRELEAGWVATGGNGEILALAADAGLGLEVDGRRGEVSGRFRVEPDGPRWLTLRRGEPRSSAPSRGALRRALEETAGRWRRRAGEVPFAGPHRERVVRSALLLDLLTHAPTGAVVEAPTTSLPGAGRSRDGRALVRSRSGAAAVLAALEGLGRRREARRFRRVLAESGSGGDPPGDVPGSRAAAAGGLELDHLHGYRGHRPVRAGPGGDGAGDRPHDLARAFEEARDRALEGRVDEASEALEAAAGAAGPTGLLAEARDPESGRLAGNFPSSVAHASLVDAARAVASRRGQKDQ